MRLVEIALQNFRGYGRRTALPVGNITGLIGKNDAGKSTFLEALNIVLAEGKIDATDIHVQAADGDEIRIECVFGDLPSALTLDSGSSTSLQDEYLVDAQGRLHVCWAYSIAGHSSEKRIGKAQFRVFAQHPSDRNLADLHSKKNAELKQLVKNAGIEHQCDLKNNASMRRALWQTAKDSGSFELNPTELDLSKEDGKSIASQIQAAMPIYVLFRADRPSTDQDAEVQDPMRVAVRTALDELKGDIDAIKEKVKRKAVDVANRTLDSLREFDSALASSLTPDFADPKLDSAFKMTLLGDDGIAVNKRGSGVRRLVLFSFFKAEADRLRDAESGRSIIYAVEEPETAQHPDFQRMVISTLQKLSETDGCQVIFTTHSPGLAGLVASDSVRLISISDGHRAVAIGDDALHGAVTTLGVVPDHRVRVLVCVEGPHDRNFLRVAARKYREAGEDFVCLESDPAVAFILLGGSTLGEWVSGNLLRNLNIPEYHLYDNDVSKYRDAVANVNSRGNGHSARQTKKRELENYLHPAAIRRVLIARTGHMDPLSIGPDDDVEAAVAAAIKDRNGNTRKKVERRELKSWLNNEVVSAMSVEEFNEQDPIGELKSWLRDITNIARRS